ncbi:MAG: hypothetical protein JWN93_1413 [Hyphomicrobiales bacterium]|nr:hypothetical protein [Hyphomicrobiales bacterium]
MQNIYSAALSLSLKISLVAASFAQSMLLARWMSPDEFGKFTIALTLSMLLGGAATCGQQTALLRFLPEYAVSGKQSLLRGVVAYAFKLTLIGSLAALAVFYAGLLVFSGGAWRQNIELFAAGPLILAWAFSELLMGLMRGFGYITWSIAPRDLLWRLGTIAAAFLLLTQSGSVSAYALVMASAALLLIIAALQYLASRREWRGAPQAEAHDQGVWRRVAASLTLATLVSSIAAQADVPLIGLILPPEEAGRFFVVQRVASVILVASAAMNVFYAAKFSALFFSGRMSELQDFTTRMSLLALALATPVFVFIEVFPEFTLGLFGPEFARYGLELRIMCVAYFLDCMAGPVGLMLLLSGHERRHVHILVASTCLRAALIVVGASRWGILGAAAGSALGHVLLIALLWITVRQRTGIEPSAGGSWRLLHQSN